LQAGVGLIDTRPFYADKQSSREFILGFGSLTEKKIEEGVRRIARALR
jgi:DNA-binding transcriptional MocR family regulator